MSDGFVRPQPFLKWAGGKRWLAPRLVQAYDLSNSSYIEPFLGGGAICLALAPSRGLVSDANEELINCYKMITCEPRAVEAGISDYQKHHSEEFYYHVRSSEPVDDLCRAVRFLYLNRACFNGIYRVNKLGKFNVPKGSKDKVYFPTDDFVAVSKVLRRLDIKTQDFEVSIDAAQKGDYLFVDPPYTVKHNKNGFVRYNEKLFSWADQERLALAIGRACARGARAIVTNADHPSVRELYDGISAAYYPISRHSVIGGPRETRSQITEAIFMVGCFGPDSSRHFAHNPRPAALKSLMTD
jgi:DNA adenine methylase